MVDTTGKRAILHIPSSQMMVDYSVADWIESFKRMSGQIPTEIVLPGVDFSGPCYDSEISGMAVGITQQNSLQKWVRDARDTLPPEITIWMSIIPSMRFLQVDTVMVEDQYGNRLQGNACIGKGIVQNIFRKLIEESSEFGIDGIVFDLTDIYPNSASNIIRKQIQNTCFCNSCVKDLNLNKWQNKSKPFIGGQKDNLSRFLLRLDSDGANNFEARHQWIRSSDAQSLINVSLAREFIDDSLSNLADAEQLLRYIDARR